MEANSVTDLPSDLIRKITGELSLADQIRFRFVCQDFLSLPLQNNRAIDKLPWLVNLLETNIPSQLYCKLYDTIHEKPYTTSLINIGDDKLFSSSYSSYCITSKHGWVFLAIGKGYITSFILFSPFTEQIIELPDFYHCSTGRDITFSSDPISKECVFCFLFSDQFGEFKLSTYEHGYREWCITTLSIENKGSTGIMSMAYFKGDLYYHSRRALLICNPISWPLNSYFNWNFQIANEYSEYYLLGLNGEFLVVCGTEHRDRWIIYTFDKASGELATKTSLPNTALFVASNLISVPAIGEFKHIENKIFYYDSSQEKSKFYNIIDGKTYACEGTEYEFLVKKHCSQGIWIDYPPHIIIEKS